MAPIKLAVFSAKPYDRKFLSEAQVARDDAVEFIFHQFPLSMETVPLVLGASAVCVFVNDAVGTDVLQALHEEGVRAVLLRCAGHNNVDLEAAERLGMFVARVPSYSPQAVAEFSVALLQTLNRQTHRAYNRVREGNFSLDGLLGRTLHGKTVGIVGTGRIGLAASRILRGYGCRVLAYDPYPTDEFVAAGGEAYLPLEKLLPQCDFVSLHCPLEEGTRHIIRKESLALMKPGALLVNTSRGGLIDTHAVIAALKDRHLGGLALDVYESEGNLFYDDHSDHIIDDDALMRLMTFPNVIVCGHQAFFTEEALSEIASSTLQNLDDFFNKRPCTNALLQPDLEADVKPYGHMRRASFPVRI